MKRVVCSDEPKKFVKSAGQSKLYLKAITDQASGLVDLSAELEAKLSESDCIRLRGELTEVKRQVHDAYMRLMSIVRDIR